MYTMLWEHNQPVMTISIKERTHFFIKIYLSHFILERVMFVVCGRWAGDCYIDPGSSRDHSSTSSSSWLGLPNRGSLRAQSPLSAAGSHFGILSPTDSNRPGHLVILFFKRPPASTVLLLIYTGASLDWRLGRGSIYNNNCCRLRVL